MSFKKQAKQFEKEILTNLGSKQRIARGMSDEDFQEIYPYTNFYSRGSGRREFEEALEFDSWDEMVEYAEDLKEIWGKEVNVKDDQGEIIYQT